MSILTRLVLLVLLATLPAIGIQAYNEFHARVAGEVRAAEEARRLLALIQDEQQRVVDGVHEVLVTVAETAPLIVADEERCRTFLGRLRDRLPRVHGLILTDTGGIVRCAADPELVGMNLAERPHVRMALFGQGFAVGEYVVRRADDRPVLPFGVPYADANGRLAGAVGLSLGLDWIKEYLARKPLPPHASLLLADRNGVLLGSFPDGSDGGGTGIDARVGHPLPPSLMTLARAPASGITELPGLDGEKRILAYAPVQDTPRDLFLAVGLDRDAALQSTIMAARRGAILLTLAVGLALLAAWFGARAFVLRPVARLQQVVERWRAGDHGARMGLMPDGSEISGLAHAFDTMAEALQAREREREEAHAAERRMAAILASSTDAVVELDRDGRITFANGRAEALFGDGAPEGAALTGRRFVEALPGHAAELFEDRFHRTLDRNEPTEFELWFGSRDEWHALRIFPTCDRLAVYAQDVTRRKRDERAIKQAVEQHRAVLDTAADAIILIGGDGTIRAFNRGAERMFGVCPREIVGRNIRALIPAGLGEVGQADGHPPASEDEPRIIDAGREVEGLRRDGLPVPLEMALSEWQDGNDRFFTAILRDITERKRSESALRRAKEQAERANQAKSRFLAAASHDLRQPVQSLFFFATALSDQIRNHPGHTTMQAMQQALEALKRLLDGLLDISKLDAGVVEPASTAVALQPIFDRLAAEYRLQAARKGLTLRVVATSLHARSDPMLLERIVRNLLDNALRYTRRGRVTLGARRSGGQVQIIVCDSGIGIPPERQEEIFEEFTQIGNPERDRERGLGLGLAIVRRLCSLLGHTVSLRSVPGRGSAFAIRVPRAEAPRAVVTVPPPGSVGDPENRQLVLVIDDEVIILMGLRAMLEGWGYEVLAASAEEEAIALLQKSGRRPDVVLADYRLRHGKTGPEALRAIHAHCNASIPSIILTGDTAPERIVEAQRSGFSILHKPVSAHHLRKVVGEAGAR